jgi:hypothetical protein
MRYTILYIFLLMLLACEKQTNRDIPAADLNLLVVDATLTNEHKPQFIKLTRTVTSLNAIPQPVSNAIINMTDPGHPPLFIHEDHNEKGVYELPGFFQAKPNVEYSLLISVDGQTYSAKASMAPSAAFQMLTYRKNSTTGLYSIAWVANPYNAQYPAMFEIELDWSDVPGYTNLPPESCQAKLYYYTLPTIDVSEIFAPEIEHINFPKGTFITERRYSLTAAHAEFIRAMISETTWKGGLFDSAPANVPTNLSGGALGFFAVCDVLSDTTTVK